MKAKKIATRGKTKEEEPELKVVTEKKKQKAGGKPKKQKIQCSHCERLLSSEAHLARHIRTTHKPKRDFICDFEGKKFNSKDKLRLHIFQHRKYFRVQCNVCLKEYRTNQSMRKHLRTHFEHHQCDSCGQVFRYKKLLTNHIAAIHNSEEPSVQCNFCTRLFPTKTTRDAHQKSIHQDQKQNTGYFKCPDCPLGFEMKEELRMHSFIHFEGEIHTCLDCHQIFKKKKLLNNHMLKHERASFQCTDCGTYFKYRSNLGKHVKHGRCKGNSLNEVVVKNEPIEGEAEKAKSQLIEMTVNSTRVEEILKIKKENLLDEEIKDEVEAEINEESFEEDSESGFEPELPEIKEEKVEIKPVIIAPIELKTNPVKVEKRTYLKKKPKKILKPAGIPYECDLCDFTTEMKSQLLSHMRRHVSSKRNKCKYCSETFRTQRQLHQHSMDVHGHGFFGSIEYNKIEECEICHRKLSETRIKAHLKLHSMSKYECGKCGKIFRDQIEAVENHKKSCQADKKYTCSTCGKSFSKLRVLKQHEEIHNPLKIYVQCEVCNTMMQIKSFKLHMEIKHGDKYKEKNHVCECGKAFRYEKQLSKHIESVHKKVNRGIIYPCPDCDEVFNRRQDLREHSFSHYTGKIFLCKCGMKFKNRKLLTIHSAVHSGKSYPCEFCSLTFQTRGGRRKHNARVHGQVLEELLEIPSYESIL